MAREDIARNSLTSAERVLEQAILLDSQSAEGFHLLGFVYSKKGRLKKAILAFERALNLDPTHTDAAIALSSLYNDVGRYSDGAKVFSKTKQRLAGSAPGHDPRINQSLAERHYEQGLLYNRFERFQEAQHEFAKALNLGPGDLKYAVQMAKCLARIGDKEGAVTLLRKSVQAHPNHIDPKIQLGILYHSTQRLKEAQREWEEALALDPQNKSAQMYLSMLEYEPQ